MRMKERSRDSRRLIVTDLAKETDGGHLFNLTAVLNLLWTTLPSGHKTLALELSFSFRTPLTFYHLCPSCGSFGLMVCNRRTLLNQQQVLHQQPCNSLDDRH